MALELPGVSNLIYMRVRQAVSLGPTLKYVHRSKPLVRQFHVTARRPFVNECLVQTHALIGSLHDVTGLPWAATIPLTAVFFSGFVMFPIDYHTRKLLQGQRLLDPQVEKARRIIAQNIARTETEMSTDEKNKLLVYLMERARHDIYRKNGFRRWISLLRLLRLLRFPIWLTAMESLRHMTGVDEGLFGLVGKSMTGGQSTVLNSLNHVVIPTEHSLAVEGMLWFPNLLIPDPALLLPFIQSAVLLVSATGITLGFRIARKTPTSLEQPRVAVFGSKTLIDKTMAVLALIAGPATLKFPSVMLLYWISSSLSTLFIRHLVKWLLPVASRAQLAKPAPLIKRQQFRGPTMAELRSQQKKQKKK